MLQYNLLHKFKTTYFIHSGCILFTTPFLNRYITSKTVVCSMFFFAIALNFHQYAYESHSLYNYYYKNVKSRNPLLGERFNLTRTFESMKKFYLREFKFISYFYKNDCVNSSYNVFHLTFFQWYSYRYGFGKSLTKKLLLFMGINTISAVRPKDYFSTNFPYTNVQNFFLSSVSCLDDTLAMKVHRNQRTNIRINCRKGIRLFAGLPCRGQRTRANAKTSRKHSYMFDCRINNPVHRTGRINPWIT